MVPYKPLKIAGFESGLVQEREEFLLVEDAFPVLENAYIWREKIIKKRGKEYFGRLRRVFTSETLPVTGASPYTVVDLVATFGSRVDEPDAALQCKTAVLVFDDGGADETTIEDLGGTGTLTLQDGSANTMGFTTGTINYLTGAISASFSAITAGVTVDISFGYYPALPSMGLRTREKNSISEEDTIAFDTKYSYVHTTLDNWQELVVGTTWSGSNSQFFWTTNFWVDAANNKLFWATNFTSGGSADPMRYYDGSTWTTFSPLITATDTLYTALIILPFRGRLLALNTFEGTTAGGAANARQNGQRIRWSQIGTPIATDSWQQDIRGKGNFLDIPTSEHIVSAGFVRDNLVIYCERSTWQLRYVGRDISPFQIERVNTELGAESTFSAIQFDKSLVGIGDKRIVSCNSFDSEPIDIKIPDFVINIENDNNGRNRVYGVRDIAKRLTYWTYPSTIQSKYQGTFPNRVLLYNYENESWAILKDSITCYGYLWISEDPTWQEMEETTWGEASFAWTSGQNKEPVIVCGNQQGYIHKFTTLTANEQSLQITAITGNTTIPTSITSPNHNLELGDIIEIKFIPTGTGYESLNAGIYSVDPTDADNFNLYIYQDLTDSWDLPQLDAPATYIGCGQIIVRDNFHIQTKKFHHMDEGKKIQVGYVDALLSTATFEDAEIFYKVLVDYSDTQMNINDSFFNTRVPTTASEFDIDGATKYWHRIFAALRGNFIQLDFSLSNAQMNSDSAISEMELHALIVWERTSGRLTI